MKIGEVLELEECMFTILDMMKTRGVTQVIMSNDGDADKRVSGLVIHMEDYIAGVHKEYDQLKKEVNKWNKAKKVKIWK